MWPEALRMAKTNFLLEKLIEEKGFTVSDEEIDNRIAEAAADMGLELEQVRNSLMQMKEGIEITIKTDKAVDYLIENAVIKEQESNLGGLSSENQAL